MNHDIGAEVERVLQVRRCEGVVDDEDRPDGVRGLRGGADVDDVQHRVGGALDPDHPRVRVEVVGEVRELRRRQVVEEIPLRLVDLRGHPVDAAVDVRDQDNAFAWVDEVHQRRRRAEAGGESDAVLRVLERGERHLQRRAGRVRDARVVVALVDADRFLHERRGLVDRRDDRAGRRVGLLAVVDRSGLEVHYRLMLAAPSQAARSSRASSSRDVSPQAPSSSSTPVFLSKRGSARPTTRSPASSGST